MLLESVMTVIPTYPDITDTEPLLRAGSNLVTDVEGRIGNSSISYHSIIFLSRQSIE